MQNTSVRDTIDIERRRCNEHYEIFFKYGRDIHRSLCRACHTAMSATRRHNASPRQDVALSVEIQNEVCDRIAILETPALGLPSSSPGAPCC